MKKFTLLSLLAVAASSVAADQTHYDLIRPVYPMTWDPAEVSEGGTVLGFDKFEKGTAEGIRDVLPEVGAVPEEFKPNGFISDTLNQGFIDALSLNVGNILINQAGFLPSDPEQMFYYTSASDECSETYSVVDLEGKEIAKGGTFTSTEYTDSFEREVSAYEISLKTRYTATISGDAKKVCAGKLADMAGLPTNQRLRIKVGKELSPTFIISDEVYSMVRDAGLKYFGAQRSGDSESWFHGPSHMNDGDGKLTGGWYDAGDHLKNSITMSYTLMALSAMAVTNPQRDDDHYAYNHNEVEKTDNIPDALREAKHGADFFLRSYAQAKGVIDNMAVTVGKITNDHNSWNRADGEPTRESAAERPAFLGNLGSDVSSNIAAGLALLSKSYAKYDKDFADSCLMVAEKLYDFARSLKLGLSSYDDGKPFVHNTLAGGWSLEDNSYISDGKVDDELAMAAVSLLYATDGKSTKADYLGDLVSDKTLNDNSANAKYSPDQFFEGGWFGTQAGFNPGAWTSDYENIHTFPLYTFYKLILADEDVSKSFGIEKEQRLAYIEKVIFILTKNVEQGSRESASTSKALSLVSSKKMPANYNGLTFSLWEGSAWAAHFYDIGAQLSLLMFADVAKDITEKDINLPNTLGATWNYKEARQIVINRMNYLLGMNRWGLSMVVGVGDKNESHVHHRTSNPEFYNGYDINAPYTELYPDYSYRPLVGAFLGGTNKTSFNSNVKEYTSVESTLYGAAPFQAILMLLSKERSATADPTDATPQAPSASKSLNVVKHGSMLEVNYTLNQSAPAEIQLVSIKGKTIRKFSEHQGAGSHTAHFDLSNVPAGVYMVKAKAGSMNASKMIQLTK